MGLLWSLFQTFFTIGMVSFGGGFAMIPVIEREVLSHEWMTASEFADVVAVAGMSPGPIATNAAVYIGFELLGWKGAVVSVLAILLPSMLIMLLLAACFAKIHSSEWVQSAFYGIRPVVTGLILIAAIRFASVSGAFASVSLHNVLVVFIMLLALIAMLRYRLHPLPVLLASGVIGAAFFG